MDSSCQGPASPLSHNPWTRFQTSSCLSQAVQEDGQGGDGNGGEKGLCRLLRLGKPQRNHTAVLKELCRVRASPQARHRLNRVHVVWRSVPCAKMSNPVARDLGGGGGGHSINGPLCGRQRSCCPADRRQCGRLPPCSERVTHASASEGPVTALSDLPP